MTEKADPLVRYDDRIFCLLLGSWEGLKEELLNPIPLKPNYELYKSNFLECLRYFEGLWEHDERIRIGLRNSDDIPNPQALEDGG